MDTGGDVINSSVCTLIHLLCAFFVSCAVRVVYRVESIVPTRIFVSNGLPDLPRASALFVTTDGIVVVVFTLYRSFYPTTSAIPTVSFLILHPREIQILWSQTLRKKKTKR